MVSLGLIEYIIIALVVFVVLKLIVQSIRFIFYFFLVALVIVLFFGISSTDIFRLVNDILLWVL